MSLSCWVRHSTRVSAGCIGVITLPRVTPGAGSPRQVPQCPRRDQGDLAADEYPGHFAGRTARFDLDLAGPPGEAALVQGERLVRRGALDQITAARLLPSLDSVIQRRTRLLTENLRHLEHRLRGSTTGRAEPGD